MIFQYVTVVGILQKTIIFAEDEDNMDRECQIIKEKNESTALKLCISMFTMAACYHATLKFYR